MTSQGEGTIAQASPHPSFALQANCFLATKKQFGLAQKITYPKQYTKTVSDPALSTGLQRWVRWNGIIRVFVEDNVCQSQTREQTLENMCVAKESSRWWVCRSEGQLARITIFLGLRPSNLRGPGPNEGVPRGGACGTAQQGLSQ